MPNNRFSAHKIALAGIGAAISLLAVTAAFYVRVVSLSFYVIAALGMLLPLTQKYYKETVFAYIAVCGIGAIYTTLHILPFLFVTGGYTIVAIVFHEKKIKPYIVYPIVIAYSCLVFFLLYQVTGVLFVDWEGLNLGHIPLWGLYLVGNVIFSLAFVVYDIAIVWVYKWLVPKVSKIRR